MKPQKPTIQNSNICECGHEAIIHRDIYSEEQEKVLFDVGYCTIMDCPRKKFTSQSPLTSNVDGNAFSSGDTQSQESLDSSKSKEGENTSLPSVATTPDTQTLSDKTVNYELGDEEQALGEWIYADDVRSAVQKILERIDTLISNEGLNPDEINLGYLQAQIKEIIKSEMGEELI